MHRLFLPAPLSGPSVHLGEQALRHVRALRLREGDEVAVFNGEGGQWRARLLPAQRVELLEFDPVERELEREVELAVGMPANERMDWLVEKATELGAATLAPLMSTRGVLRLQGERAQRRLAHWRGVTIAACEQCGRNRLPQLREVATLQAWLHALPPAAGQARCLLAAPRGDTAPVQAFASWAAALEPAQPVLALSGPEGGLDEAEIDAALRAGFVPLSLGRRTLRAETAPLALLAALAALDGRPA